MAADKSAGTDLKAHEQTYESFTRLMKSSAIAVGIIALLMILIISR